MSIICLADEIYIKFQVLFILKNTKKNWNVVSCSCEISADCRWNCLYTIDRGHNKAFSTSSSIMIEDIWNLEVIYLNKS